MKNKVTFDYSYMPPISEDRKAVVDAMIVETLNHAFWQLYHSGFIIDFHLVDEDLNPSTGENDDEDNL